MSQTATPAHASLLQQCQAGVQALDQRLGRDQDQASERMAASLAALAAEHGLSRVDHVLLGVKGRQAQAGEHVFVVQGTPSDPAHLRAHMGTEQAVNTPVEASLQRLDLALQATPAGPVQARPAPELRGP